MNLSFATGGLLWALLALPLLYFLVRMLPPQPKEVNFPALRILQGLQGGEALARTPPWWLVLLRVLIAALLVLGVAGPRLVPRTVLSPQPLVILLDNSWPSAALWPTLERTTRSLLNTASTQNKPVWLWPLSDEAPPLVWQSAADAQKKLDLTQPQQQSLNLPEAFTWLGQHLTTPASILFLSSGVVERTQLPHLTQGRTPDLVYQPSTLPWMIHQVTREGDSLQVVVQSLNAPPEGLTVELHDLTHRVISRAGTSTLTPQKQEATLQLSGLPTQPGYVTLQGQNHIAAWWGVPNLGGQPRVLVWAPEQKEFPLLSGRYYIQHALAEEAQISPYPDLPDDLTTLDAIVAAQVPHHPEKILAWVRHGGVYISLAGNWLQGHTDIPLLPSPLRPQPRLLSGPLQLEGAITLTQATASGPLQHMTLDPAALISQQWLPHNGWAEGVEVWLKLKDDTPLVSARKVGQGFVVLVHTGAEAAWSTLPLTGAFPSLLNTLVRLGQKQGSTDTPPLPWPPQQLFDVYSHPSPLAAQPLTQAHTPVTPHQPIGFYGTPAQPHRLDGQQRLLAPLPPTLWPHAAVRYYNTQSQSVDLTPWVLLLVICLLLIDTALRVELRRPGQRLLLLACLLWPLSAVAETSSPTTALGWIASGDPSVDQITAAGLWGLSQVVNQRTSVTLGTPQKLDPARQNLGLYPLLLWPMVEGQPLPSPPAARALRAYVASGGILLIDSITLRGPAPRQTQTVLNDVLGVSLAPLETDHTLQRSFYLLRGHIVGRQGNQPLWRDTAGPLARLLVASHDLAGAWAINERGMPQLPMLAGGENTREESWRFGVNLVLYTLLGDYKKDQLHVDTLLKLFENRGL